MRYQDLSNDSKTLISEFQNKKLGSNPLGLLGIASALAMDAPLEKIDTSNELGIERSIIIKRHLERQCGDLYRSILEAFLDFVPFDFKFAQELTGDLYSLRYVQAFDIDVFISSLYKLDFYIENNFTSYRIRMNENANISKEIVKTMMENGMDIVYYATLFKEFINDLKNAGVISSNKLMDVGDA
jgi:hypothetical protein